MKFAVEKQVFLKGLAKIQGIVEKKNTIPVLANVLITAEEDRLCLTATDLEVGMRAFYPAHIESAGSITVSAKKLYEIIRELPEGEISFRAKENCWIEIRGGKALFNLVGLSPDEFPFFPTADDNETISLQSDILSTMIEKTAFAMSADETKYNLNGIFFKTREDDGKHALVMAATDGHRLAKIQRPIDQTSVPQLEKGVIFPRKGIFELKKIAEEGDNEINLGFLENSAIINKGDTTVVMRLVDGEFPEYERVIPTGNNLTAHIPSETFLHALRRMATLSSEKSKGVRIALKEGLMEISSSNPELGDAREDIEVDYSGQEVAIGFNARYLLDILQSIDEEQVAFHLKDNLSPGLMTPVEDKNYLAVIMPMRL